MLPVASFTSSSLSLNDAPNAPNGAKPLKDSYDQAVSIYDPIYDNSHINFL